MGGTRESLSGPAVVRNGHSYQSDGSRTQFANFAIGFDFCICCISSETRSLDYYNGNISNLLRVVLRSECPGDMPALWGSRSSSFLNSTDFKFVIIITDSLILLFYYIRPLFYHHFGILGPEKSYLCYRNYYLWIQNVS